MPSSLSRRVDVARRETRDAVEVEALERGAEVVALGEDGPPAQAGLEALETQLLEQAPVIVHRKSPFGVVIGEVVGQPRHQRQRSLLSGPGAVVIMARQVVNYVPAKSATAVPATHSWSTCDTRRIRARESCGDMNMTWKRAVALLTVSAFLATGCTSLQPVALTPSGNHVARPDVKTGRIGGGDEEGRHQTNLYRAPGRGRRAGGTQYARSLHRHELRWK